MFLCKIMSITEAIYYLEQIFSMTNIFFVYIFLQIKIAFLLQCFLLLFVFALWLVVDQGEAGGAGSSSKRHISSPLTGPPMRAGSLGDKKGGRLEC